MSIETALAAQLKVQVPSVAGRVRPGPLPQEAPLPTITYQRISTATIEHRGGQQYERPRFQIDGWAATFDDAILLRAHIRTAMAGWRQLDGPRVDGARMRDDRDIRETDTGRWRASLDYIISCRG